MQRYSAQEQFIKATQTTQTTKSMPDVVILQKLGVSKCVCLFVQWTSRSMLSVVALQKLLECAMQWGMMGGCILIP